MLKDSDLLRRMDVRDVVDVALEAGCAVMKIYEKDFNVEYKDDRSPLTEADKKAHEIIVNGLQSIIPKPKTQNPKPLPILSEEGKDIPYEERKNWNAYWCVDPIDGTKEFIKKNGEFTINIALIQNNEPMLGVVYAPALNVIYWAQRGKGAFKGITTDNTSEYRQINNIQPLGKNQKTKHETRSTIQAVASRSHLTPETEKFIESLGNNVELVSKGSSLKLLMIAEGSADIYPRLAPTMEWDTAAADAIVREAGKMTYQYTQSPKIQNPKPLVYNKKGLLNPWFVVK